MTDTEVNEDMIIWYRHLHVRQPLRRPRELRGVHAAPAHHVTQQLALPLLVVQLHRKEYVSQVRLSIYYLGHLYTCK